MDSLPQQPDPKTKEDAYKLAMLAAQLERREDGGLDLFGAYQAWKESIKFVAEQYRDKQAEGIRFDTIDFKFLPLEEALEQMDLTPQNWKNTMRKKLERNGFSKQEINENFKVWQKFGVPEFHIEQFRNERTKPIAELDD